MSVNHKPLIVPSQVSWLSERGVLEEVESVSGPVFIQIGRSKIDNLDPLLVQYKYSFLITFDPVFSAAPTYARRLQLLRAPETFHPLGKISTRSLLLPFAIRNTLNRSDVNGEVAPMSLTTIQACAGFRKADASSLMGAMCQHVREYRMVHSVSLEVALNLIGRQVRYVHLDTRTSDLDIVFSAGTRLSEVDYFSLQLLSDDCTSWFVHEKKCSEVVTELSSKGFVAAAAISCRPRWPRVKENAYCRIRAVFRRKDLERPPPELIQYHRMHLNGCSKIFSAIKDAESTANNQLIATSAFRVGQQIRFRRKRTYFNNSMGEDYACPRRCFLSASLASAPCPWL